MCKRTRNFYEENFCSLCYQIFMNHNSDSVVKDQKVVRLYVFLYTCTAVYLVLNEFLTNWLILTAFISTPSFSISSTKELRTHNHFHNPQSLPTAFFSNFHQRQKSRCEQTFTVVQHRLDLMAVKTELNWQRLW